MSLQSSLTSLRAYLRPSIAPSAHLHHIRHASLNSAIGRGIRRSQYVDDVPQRRNTVRDARDDRRNRNTAKHDKRPEARGQRSGAAFDKEEFIKTGKFRALPRAYQRETPGRKNKDGMREDPDYVGDDQDIRNGGLRALSQEYQSRGPARPARKVVHRPTDEFPEEVKSLVRPPSSVPYTTPASQFVYGISACMAALRCSRRRIYKLYIYQSEGRELSPEKKALRKLALLKNVTVKMAFASWGRLLDQMSDGRPHQGCILEVSPLPRLPVQNFRPVPSPEADNFGLELGAQSREEAQVNTTNNTVDINNTFGKRYPVVILLDGIVDPGNLGAIIRSAYYLGADAIVFAGRNSAEISPVVLKASAGAAELMTLLHVRNEVDFIRRSKDNGWRFYAADAPGKGSTSTYIDPAEFGNGAPVAQAPSVIMMGSEGTGLSPHILSQADAVIGIPGAKFSPELGAESDPARVDSLNVSVAAALLMNMFLRVPVSLAKKEDTRVW
ncbi:rRNA methyltransferase 1, mitochondrial [Aspergillus awamori]|uniref:rRNA methyltransferase 1, mitochondrial n=5 Tax=Aspergillus TaxID=5052 RepID=A2Q9U9_ASPNC|nr:uncharacterized protein An01g09170 [Aspergillus niger]EHA26762.1 hypothetical protein ASPNIDRAFT_35811 [Aspergillus niger ATCC 1015]RDH17821.1 hypothetical protein M747DRAFT_284517 [Aspergillus niger ATCC 13496]GCB26399.1 rRNA methyltransferase 1, mitochondrial [Aspergillus awamori]KAI2822784.1 hypothetical protein CBS115989_1814 [Aspergillus niger]KAI2845338.1 hypothetical protein CBS11350_4357 [Aspergillus niger]|eukprot:XP_001389338.1 RNA methyltransferase, TrmH family [Aspergillus niger CBS 513.88]